MKYLKSISGQYKWRNIMKKQTILAFTAALGIAMSVSAPVEAASVNRVYISVFEKDCTTDQWSSVETDSISDVLKKICDRFPAIVLPGDCMPELPKDDKEEQTPDTSGKPGASEKPDISEKPGTSEKPEGSQPGGTESGGNGIIDSEQSKDDVTETSYAKQILKLVNAERKKAGLNELVWDETVTTAAMTRSKEIEKSFSHTRPDGRGFGTAITDLGITYRGAGENIAWGQKTPEAVMNAWMNSEGHRANILNPNFKKIGVGYRTNSQGTTYWTQLFTY